MSHDHPPVTICPPGKRAGKAAVMRQPVIDNIRVTYQTALVSPPAARLAPPARNDRRSAQERVEAAERAEAVSVALAQPHRNGIEDKMLVDPLGVFCRQSWPPRLAEDGRDLNEDHRGVMYRAGQIYAEIVHKHRVYLDLGAGGRTQADGFSLPLTDAKLREKCEEERIKRDNADGVLRGVHGSAAVSAMVRIAVDETPPTPYQEDLLRHCLWVLAVHFGLVKTGINSGKGY